MYLTRSGKPDYERLDELDAFRLREKTLNQNMDGTKCLWMALNACVKVSSFNISSGKKMSTKKVAILLAVCLGCLILAIGGCGAILYIGYRNADRAISSEIDDMLNEHSGEIYQLKTTDGFKSKVSEEKFLEMSEMIVARIGSLKSKVLIGYRMSRRKADTLVDVTYTGTFEKGTGRIIAKLVKQDLEWKFVAFRVESPVFAVRCTSCGKTCDQNAKYCPTCGKKFPQSVNAE